ncbi:MAG TPA: hypothetical protein VES91_00055 [Burkholderiaceae bacterium]|nr:hypothetical protein [Burkholderiaceae bacterium]
MPDSTLDLSRATPPVTGKGHGTAALGPSDTSDSGSDLQGPGVYEDDADILDLDVGTNEDEAHAIGAGRDVGDANLDSDSDAGGTGERATAGRDTDVEAGSDIAPDRLVGSGAPIPTGALDGIAVDDVDDESERDDE